MSQQAESLALRRAQWWAIGSMAASLALTGLLMLLLPRLAQPEMRWIPIGLVLLGFAVGQFIVGAQKESLGAVLSASRPDAVVLIGLMVNIRLDSSGAHLDLRNALLMIGTTVVAFGLGRVVAVVRRPPA